MLHIGANYVRTLRGTAWPSACEVRKMSVKRLNVQERKDIFRHLVNTQDAGALSVSQSRQSVIKEYEITDAQLRQIEEEGLEKEWPPLDKAVHAG
jgi:hypothetical protein